MTPSSGETCDADRHPDHGPHALDRIGVAEVFDDLLRQLGQLLAPETAGDDHLEFIAAQPTDAPGLVNRALEPLRHLHQQGIAGRVPHGIVDLLEAIEIEQEDGAGALFDARRIEDLFQRLRHLEAIGETGQRIVMRQPRGIFLASASSR